MFANSHRTAVMRAELAAHVDVQSWLELAAEVELLIRRTETVEVAVTPYTEE